VKLINEEPLLPASTMWNNAQASRKVLNLKPDQQMTPSQHSAYAQNRKKN